MEFYAQKGREKPRFIYRNFADALTKADTADARTQMIDAFCQSITDLQPSGDWYKFKWSFPRFLSGLLSPEEASKIEDALAKKRRKRNEKFIEAYPHCSDEFSMNVEFLDAAFGADKTPAIAHDTKIITFGSCFAHNIAHYLKSKDYNITPFVQMEDLNSPFSNAIMLAACAASEQERRAYVEYWIRLLYSDHRKREQFIETMLERLQHLRALIETSDFLIMTCGNVLDYFLSDKHREFSLGNIVAPKFLFVAFKEDVEDNMNLSQTLKKAGSEFRMGSYQEVQAAMDALYYSIRAINPHIQLLITLSPVPIDSAMGISHIKKMGAVEMDCLSKSTLRTALGEFMLKHQATDKNLFYFPSFEIVRWIAPNFDFSVFGKEDAASRHVSQEILQGIYEYFLYKFGKGENPTTSPQNLRSPITRHSKKKWWQFWG